MTAGVRHWTQYLLLRSTIAGLRFVGFRAAGAIGARIGLLGYRPLGIRRDIVERQIAASLPDRSPAAVHELARASYAHLGRATIETALLPSFSRRRILDLFERVEGWEVVEELMQRGRGIILVTGHLGNWELGGAYLAARGLAVDAVARGMENPLFDAYLTATRRRIGINAMNDAEAVRKVPRALRAGRAVAFLVDQGAIGLASTWVPFFGVVAKTPRGPAVFALRLNVPIVFGAATRQPNGRYVFSLESIDVERTGDLNRDVDAIVAKYTMTLERHIRRHPEQYFWHHRRWKHRPAAEHSPPPGAP